MDLKAIKKDLIQKKATRDVYQDMINKKTLEIEQIDKELTRDAEAMKIVSDISGKAREQARLKIEEALTMAIKNVNPNESVSVRFDNINNQVACEILVRLENGKEIDPVEEDGGGLADTLALTIFEVLKNISETKTPSIIDEPTKFASRDDFSVNVGKFISTMTGQVLLATHDEYLCNIGKKFLIRKEKGVSNVTEM